MVKKSLLPLFFLIFFSGCRMDGQRPFSEENEDSITVLSWNLENLLIFTMTALPGMKNLPLRDCEAGTTTAIILRFVPCGKPYCL